MTKGLIRSIARGPAQQAPVIKQTFTVEGAAMSIVGASGVGFGSVVMGDFPAGNILFLGAAAYMQFTSVDADVVATYDGDYGIGTTPASDATITGADVDVIPSTALGAATAGVSPVVRGVSAAAQTGAILDNTDGSLELNLNLLIDDANISGTADFTVSGFLVLSYIVLGDD